MQVITLKKPHNSIIVNKLVKQRPARNFKKIYNNKQNKKCPNFVGATFILEQHTKLTE